MKHLKCQRCNHEWYDKGTFLEVRCPSCGARASPEVQVLSGEEAIKTLNDYINELEESNPEELTKKQAKIIVKLSELLISTVEGETTILDSIRQAQLLDKLKTLIARMQPKPTFAHHSFRTHNANAVSKNARKMDI